MLPRILFLDTKLSLSERKWITVKDLTFLANGLVDSTEHYIYPEIEGMLLHITQI